MQITGSRGDMSLGGRAGRRDFTSSFLVYTRVIETVTALSRLGTFCYAHLDSVDQV